ncbi:YciI family protein [Hansschlegelia zhihuaiae]|uniref:YciI family protein n=1 Tax=Hansschlegelia zhihuaiae TaxID=405005 RepID=A0A4Q0MIB6_9HYPH|nr:YciI family protein [Hansschlegelia zhihuaiae]RXF73105.1 YciI family protein [Hansschlegelia zhihuaiae]
MRFMIIRKADANTEGEDKATPELMDAMAAYNMEMIKAGVFLSGDGLQPSRKGARVKISRDGARPIVTDGPFVETKELIAGFTMIKVGSLEEALDWVRRWPKEDGPVELEVRQVYELEDFDTLGDKPEAWREMEQALKDRGASN